MTPFYWLALQRVWILKDVLLPCALSILGAAGATLCGFFCGAAPEVEDTNIFHMQPEVKRWLPARSGGVARMSSINCGAFRFRTFYLRTIITRKVH